MLAKRQYFFSILLLAMLFSNSGLLGQDMPAIDLALSLKAGETRKYRINSTTRHFIRNGEYALNSVEKDITIKILETINNKIIAEWICNNAMFIKETNHLNSLSSIFNTLKNKNMVIKYVLNQRGEIQSVTNYDEVTSRIKQQMDSAIQQMRHDPNFDPALLETLKLESEIIFSSKELLDEIILNDLYRFHELYGHTFQKGHRKLIPEKFISEDSYSIELVTTLHKCVLSGQLTSSFKDKKGRKTYEFELPSFWLASYSSECSFTEPTNFSSSYTITLISH